MLRLGRTSVAPIPVQDEGDRTSKTTGIAAALAAIRMALKRLRLHAITELALAADACITPVRMGFLRATLPPPASSTASKSEPIAASNDSTNDANLWQYTGRLLAPSPLPLEQPADFSGAAAQKSSSSSTAVIAPSRQESVQHNGEPQLGTGNTSSAGNANQTRARHSGNARRVEFREGSRARLMFRLHDSASTARSDGNAQSGLQQQQSSGGGDSTNHDSENVREFMDEFRRARMERLNNVDTTNNTTTTTTTVTVSNDTTGSGGPRIAASDRRESSPRAESTPQRQSARERSEGT